MRLHNVFAAKMKSSKTFCLRPKMPPWCHSSPYSSLIENSNTKRTSVIAPHFLPSSISSLLASRSPLSPLSLFSLHTLSHLPSSNIGYSKHAIKVLHPDAASNRERGWNRNVEPTIAVQQSRVLAVELDRLHTERVRESRRRKQEREGREREERRGGA